MGGGGAPSPFPYCRATRGGGQRNPPRATPQSPGGRASVGLQGGPNRAGGSGYKWSQTTNPTDPPPQPTTTDSGGILGTTRFRGPLDGVHSQQARRGGHSHGLQKKKCPRQKYNQPSGICQRHWGVGTDRGKALIECRHWGCPTGGGGGGFGRRGVPTTVRAAMQRRRRAAAKGPRAPLEEGDRPCSLFPPPLGHKSSPSTCRAQKFASGVWKFWEEAFCPELVDEPSSK